MARLKGYSDGDGYYIQIGYYNRPQTLQVQSSAAEFITETGYQSGDSIPREIVMPLIAAGELHTKPGGPTAKELLRGLPSLPPANWQLDSERREQLQSFLASRGSNYNPDVIERLNTFLSQKSPLKPIQVPDDQSSEAKEGCGFGARTLSGGPATTSAANGSDGQVPTVPEALRDRDQWICWRYESRDGKQTKVPVDPTTDDFASVSDPETWDTFETAVECATHGTVEGIGFVFAADDTIMGVDLDDVYDPETDEIDPKAQEIIESLDSYTEFSPSGTGFHILLHGFCPAGRSRHGGIEMYDEGRFFTVTGDHVPDTPKTVEVRHHELSTIHARYVAANAHQKSSQSTSPTVDPSQVAGQEPPGPAADVTISDERILERARQRSEKFEALWAGQTHGYPSHSEADMALCVLLAVHTGGDIRRMDRLFRQSGLMRAKWDESRGDRTYGELTMQKAVRVVDEYDPLVVDRDMPSQVPMAELEPESAATVEGTVTTIHDAPPESIHQWGRIEDETETVKFVVWENSANNNRLSLDDGMTYLLQDVWVRRFDGSIEIELNEYTTIEEQG